MTKENETSRCADSIAECLHDELKSLLHGNALREEEKARLVADLFEVLFCIVVRGEHGRD